MRAWYSKKKTETESEQKRDTQSESEKRQEHDQLKEEKRGKEIGVGEEEGDGFRSTEKCSQVRRERKQSEV